MHGLKTHYSKRLKNKIVDGKDVLFYASLKFNELKLHLFVTVKARFIMRNAALE